MSGFFFLVTIGTSIWVLIDSKTIGVKRGQIQGIGNLGPWGWFFACLILWIVVFPFYLVKRSEFKRINEESQHGGIRVTSPQNTKNHHSISKNYAKKSAALIGLGILCFVGGTVIAQHGYWVSSWKYFLLSGFILMWAGTIMGLISISPQRKWGYAWVSIIVFPLLLLVSFFLLLGQLWGNKP